MGLSPSLGRTLWVVYGDGGELGPTLRAGSKEMEMNKIGIKGMKTHQCNFLTLSAGLVDAPQTQKRIQIVRNHLGYYRVV